MLNGHFEVLTVNTTTKVHDLHTWVLSMSNVEWERYQLVRDFPELVLSQPQLTVAEAGLLDANIIQKAI